MNAFISWESTAVPPNGRAHLQNFWKYNSIYISEHVTTAPVPNSTGTSSARNNFTLHMKPTAKADVRN